MKTLYTDCNIGNMRDQDFEFIILESALENIVNKFKKLNFPQYFPFLILKYEFCQCQLCEVKWKV